MVRAYGEKHETECAPFQPVSSQPISSRPAPSKTLLVIDDSAEDRAAFRRYLTRDSNLQYRILETVITQLSESSELA